MGAKLFFLEAPLAAVSAASGFFIMVRDFSPPPPYSSSSFISSTLGGVTTSSMTRTVLIVVVAAAAPPSSSTSSTLFPNPSSLGSSSTPPGSPFPPPPTGSLAAPPFLAARLCTKGLSVNALGVPGVLASFVAAAAAVAAPTSFSTSFLDFSLRRLQSRKAITAAMSARGTRVYTEMEEGEEKKAEAEEAVAAAAPPPPPIATTTTKDGEEEREGVMGVGVEVEEGVEGGDCVGNTGAWVGEGSEVEEGAARVDVGRGESEEVFVPTIGEGVEVVVPSPSAVDTEGEREREKEGKGEVEAEGEWEELLVEGGEREEVGVLLGLGAVRVTVALMAGVVEAVGEGERVIARGEVEGSGEGVEGCDASSPNVADTEGLWVALPEAL